MIRKRRVLKALLLSAGAALVIEFMPDIARYFKIREM